MVIQKSFKLSIDECFEVNRYLVDKTPCLFKKIMELSKTETIDVFFELKDGYLKLSGINKSGIILFKKNCRLNNTKDIKDILSLYDIYFIYNLENYILTITVNYDYDKNFFTSMGEFLISHLDCLKHMKEMGRDNLLLEYLCFYNLANPVTVLYSSYILELLRDTSLFEEAVDVYTTNLITNGYELYKINQNFKEEHDVKDFLDILESSDAKYIHNINLILIGLRDIESNKHHKFHKLVTSRVNAELIYKVTTDVMIGLNDDKYLHIVS